MKEKFRQGKGKCWYICPSTAVLTSFLAGFLHHPWNILRIQQRT